MPGYALLFSPAETASSQTRGLGLPREVVFEHQLIITQCQGIKAIPKAPFSPQGTNVEVCKENIQYMQEKLVN